MQLWSSCFSNQSKRCAFWKFKDFSFSKIVTVTERNTPGNANLVRPQSNFL